MIKNKGHNETPMKIRALFPVLLLLAAILPVRAQSYSIAGLAPAPGYFQFLPTAINASGQISGNLFDENGDTHGGLYSGGTVTAIVNLPGADPFSYAQDINDAGLLTAVAVSADYGSERYFTIDSEGLVSDLGISDAGHSYPLLVNNAGQIAYTSTSPTVATLLTGSTAQPLGALPGQSASRAIALNDAGQVAGYSGSHAFLYDGTGMVDLGVLPGDTASFARGINASGAVVGVSRGNGGNRPFLYSGGTLVSLGFENISGIDRYVSAINASGLIVGDYYDSNTDLGYATLYSGGIEIDLDTTVALVAQQGGVAGFTHLISATAINDAGQIAGYGFWTDGVSAKKDVRGFLLTPVAVPEPATWSYLVVLGLFAVVAGWRKRRLARVAGVSGVAAFCLAVSTTAREVIFGDY